MSLRKCEAETGDEPKSPDIPFDAPLTKLSACIVGNLARNMGNEAAWKTDSAAIWQVIL